MKSLKFTRRRFVFLLPLAVVCGFILALLFTGQENFKQLNRDCVSTYFTAPQVKTVNCSTLDQGYPFRFLRTTPDISSGAGDILDVFAAPKISTYRLIGDVAVWSAVSLVVMLFAAPMSAKKSKR